MESTSTIVDLQNDIERQMKRGASLTAIEESVIDPAPFTEDQKAALWLFAWSMMGRSEQKAHVAVLMHLLPG